ncbi:MAG: flagellar export protein FliJ [Pirellulaceae bacterium]
MTQFRFRLESLLKLRIAERDRRREDLANAYRADQVLQQHQETLEQEIVETQQHAKQRSAPGTIHVDVLLNTHRYELVLGAQLQQIHGRRKLIAAEIERRRQALIEADRELRILEKLREKHASDFEFTQQKAEVRLMDEIALRRRKTRQEIDLR